MNPYSTFVEGGFKPPASASFATRAGSPTQVTTPTPYPDEMDLENTLKDGQMKMMNLVHRGIRAISGGKLGNTLGSMPVVELHAIGRKTGESRVTMLTTPIAEDGTFVLVASKGGDDRDPIWYLNVVANPDIELVTADGTTHQLAARTADDAEKAELWPRIVDAYKGYAGYAEKTDRDIPVVICEPRST